MQKPGESIEDFAARCDLSPSDRAEVDKFAAWLRAKVAEREEAEEAIYPDGIGRPEPERVTCAAFVADTHAIMERSKSPAGVDLRQSRRSTWCAGAWRCAAS